MDPIDLALVSFDVDSSQVERAVIDELRRWTSAPIEHATLIAFGPSEIAEGMDVGALDWFVSQQDHVRQIVVEFGLDYMIAPSDVLKAAHHNISAEPLLPPDAPTFGYLLVTPGANPRVIDFDLDAPALRHVLATSSAPRIIN